MKKKVLLTLAILATVCLTGCKINVNFTPDESASGTVSEVGAEESILNRSQTIAWITRVCGWWIISIPFLTMNSIRSYPKLYRITE